MHVCIHFFLCEPIIYHILQNSSDLSAGAVGVVNGQVFGDGVGHIYLKNLQCTGSEPNITSCTHSRETVNCGHDEDAGVICRRKLAD